jgi:Tol biopolymer transport system component
MQYKKLTILGIVILLIISIMPVNLSAQFYFGKNKVQYTDFDWNVMDTEHFRIFFYEEEEEIAQIAARIAEDGYRDLRQRFTLEIYEKIPLIIYSSPNYFAQTNILPILLPESVAGFTEYMKGRVVVPFHGSYFDFRHVIRHELVHVFTRAKLRKVLSGNVYTRTSPPPMWFIEGLAEFWSTEWDSEADMIVKDMVLAGNFVPISKLYMFSGSFFIYKLGQALCQFIDEEYGSEKILLMFENYAKGKNFSEIMELTLGERIEDISRKWEYSLKKRYFPEISDRNLVKSEARQLTKDGYSLMPVPVKLSADNHSGEWIVFMANKRGYTGLYMMPPAGERKKLYTLLKGERSAQFESLHFLRSGIDARDDGKIIFSSRSKENDVLYLYDIISRSTTNKYEFDNLTSIASPRFSPDGTKAVFSGSSPSGMNDLYIINLLTGDLKKLTNDIYFDHSPIFSDTGKHIFFASDRCLDGDRGALNIYRIDFNGDNIEQLTYGRRRDIPSAMHNGVLYFSSDKDGAFNIYSRDPDGSLKKVTSLLTGAYDARITADGKALLFTGYQDMGFHIYRKLLEKPKPVIASKPVTGNVLWKPGKLDKKHFKSSVRYQTEYSFDIAQSAMSYDPVYGSLGGVQVALSDMLGDHSYHILVANTASTKDEILSSFNVAVTYINRKNRLNWGLGVYHLYGEFFNDYDNYFTERQAGGLVYLNYPLSKFNRLETTTYLRYSNKDWTLQMFRRKAALMTNYISFISDNSLWDISGPIEGHRYNLTVGLTSRLDQGRTFNRIGMADLRHYLRLGKFSAFASRLFIYSSTGAEAQRIYFGGSWSFRGYDRREFYVRNIVFSSNELRFPLIDNLMIGFPFGGIGFRAIRGALFFDAGYLSDENFHFLDKEFFDGLIGSVGGGFRVALGRVVVLRFDFSRTTDFVKFSPNTKFEFFFGWNF